MKNNQEEYRNGGVHLKKLSRDDLTVVGTDFHVNGERHTVSVPYHFNEEEEAGMVYDENGNGWFEEDIDELNVYYVLIRTDAEDNDRNTNVEIYHTREAAYDAMVKDALEKGGYSSLEKLVEAAEWGEAGFSDDNTWVNEPGSAYSWFQWNIVEAKIKD